MLVVGTMLLMLGGCTALVLVAQGDGTDEAEAQTQAEVTSTTLPPVAVVHDCVAVDGGGHVLATGSCAEGGAPYRVTEVREARVGGACTDVDNVFVVAGAHLICLEVNLVENYCYAIPQTGFITPAPVCDAPGTVSVVDVVPGAVDDTSCTREFQWNRYYTFTSPRMVACVMAH